MERAVVQGNMPTEHIHSVISHRVHLPSRPVPSRPVPSRPVPSRPVPSRPVPSRPVRPVVPSRPVPSRPVPSCPVQPRPVPSRPVPSRPVPSRPVPSCPVQPRPVPSRPVPSVPSRPVPSRPVSCPGYSLSVLTVGSRSAHTGHQSMQPTGASDRRRLSWSPMRHGNSGPSGALAPHARRYGR